MDMVNEGFCGTPGRLWNKTPKLVKPLWDNDLIAEVS